MKKYKYSKVDRMLAEGAKPLEIQKATGVPNTTIAYRAFVLRKRGKLIPKHKPGRPHPAYAKAFGILRHKQENPEDSNAKIAEAFDSDPTTVGQIIKTAQKTGLLL